MAENESNQTPQGPSGDNASAQGSSPEGVGGGAGQTPPAGGAGEPESGNPEPRAGVSTASGAEGSAASGVEAEDIEGARYLDLPQFSGAARVDDHAELRILSDVNVQVKVELGRTRMFVEDVLKLGEGAVIELDKLAGDPVDIFVNERPIARGEILILNDSFCVRISDLSSFEDEGKRRAS